MKQEQQQQKRGCLKTVLKIVVGFIVFVIVLGVIGTIYEQNAEKAFIENNPPLGQLIDVGGRNLHINCTGTGEPTIILDAGQGGWSIDYSDLQAELAETNRVCSYDRAGYGWSDAADDQRRLEDISDDLHTLLEGAEIAQPYVIVAYSFSGLSTRYYYEQYPDEVAGLVLLDPAHEAHADLQPENLASAQESLLGMYSIFELAANVGLVRFLNPAEMAPYAPFIVTAPTSPTLYYAGLSNPDWWATSRKEFYTNLFVELPTLPSTFDVPVTIIGLSDSIADPEFADMNDDQLAILQEMADRSENVNLIVLDGIAHEGIIHEVEMISSVIREMLGNEQG